MYQAMSNEEIMHYAPSAFAATPYHAQSSRYAFIPTVAVIDGMRNAGFLPVKASQSNCRIADKRDFTKHMIRFRSAAALSQTAVVGDSVLEAVLINSHDGTSAYKLMCGIFRFVCSNGMVVADSLLESINIRHTGNVIGDVIDGSNRILENGPRVMNVVNDWKRLQLTMPEQKLLAESAHSLRFPADEDGKVHTNVTPEMLLQPSRREDNRPDLWHTFNRIQENSIKGMRTRDQHWRRVSSRNIKGIDQDVRLNRALWTLAEKFAALKNAA
jgi:Domain of unknown function (DUF932)